MRNLSFQNAQWNALGKTPMITITSSKALKLAFLRCIYSSYYIRLTSNVVSKILCIMKEAILLNRIRDQGAIFGSSSTPLVVFTTRRSSCLLHVAFHRRTIETPVMALIFLLTFWLTIFRPRWCYSWFDIVLLVVPFRSVAFFVFLKTIQEDPCLVISSCHHVHGDSRAALPFFKDDSMTLRCGQAESATFYQCFRPLRNFNLNIVSYFGLTKQTLLSKSKCQLEQSDVKQSIEDAHSLVSWTNAA